MIELDRGDIGPLEEEYALRAIREREISTAGKYVAIFEERMSEYFGRPCVATNSGTAALILALNIANTCKDIYRNNIRAIPALSFIATKNVVYHLKDYPFVKDISLETWNNQDWVCIIVDLYGVPSFIHGVAEIADSCEAMGATINGRKCGTLSRFGAISFNGNKTMTTGGGGLLICENQEDAALAWKLAHQGKYDGVGYNYGMTSLAAAIGLAQMERLDDLLAKKRLIHEIYVTELDGLVKFQQAPENSEPSWWMTACLLPEDIDVNRFQWQLADGKGIPTRRIFKPLGPNCPNAEYIYKHGVCLPSSTLNGEKEILTVCKEIKRLL